MRKTAPSLFLLILLELTLLLSLAATILLPANPANRPVPSRDSGVFLYTGWRILNGQVPYRDVWDHKTPLIYYIDALGIALTPNSSWGVWVVEVFSLWASAALGYFLFKRLYDGLTATFLSFLWLLTACYMLVGGNLTNEYGLPFQFGILWLFYRAESKSRYGWRGFAIGVLSALLFFTRQNAVAIPLALGFYLVFNRVFGLQFSRLKENLLLIVGGGLLITGWILAYFAWQGALSAFWNQAILYNIIYTNAVTNAERFSALMSGINQLSNLGLAQLAAGGAGAALLLLLFKPERFSPPARALLWVTLLALPFELWMVTLSGRPRVPYFVTLIPVFTVFAGLLVALIFEALKNDLPRAALSALVIVLVAGLWSAAFSDLSELSLAIGNPETQALVDYIQSHSAPTDTVLMWGAETAYNYAARRASPTRFVYQYPLYRGDYANKQNVTEFVNDLITNKPRLIIMTSVDKFSDFRFGFRDYQIGGLMQYLEGFYTQSDQVGNWVIYTYTGQ